ncbi:MAG: LuxR C-terminal-related transcriptional regulator [Pseudomonadota bacterium]
MRAGTDGASPHPGVAWMDDEALVPLPHAHDLQGGGLLVELLSARHAAERRERLRAALKAAGFEWLAYGRMRMQGGMPVATSFFPAYAHPDWTALYFGERLYEADFRHVEAAPCGLPRAWALEQMAERGLGPEAAPRQRGFVQLLCASGLRRGVFMNLASPGGRHERTVVSLSSSLPGPLTIGQATLGQAVLLALAVHEFLSVHVSTGSAGAAPGPLSPVQEDILRRLALGESDRQISQHLQLSAHTVDYHLRCLRRRFGARNRAQLVCAALEASGT